MLKLYKKNELKFSLVLIVAYVSAFSVADMISLKIGLLKVVTAPVGLILSLILIIFLYKNKLKKAYGLVAPKFSAGLLADIIFLSVLSLSNIVKGIAFNYTFAETLLIVLSMLFVGFIEEMIFRGFLFQALRKINPELSVIISSLSFGAGHIINLLCGADLPTTLLQICYASAIGYVFTVIFIKRGSIIPCIVCHSLVNILSVFRCNGDSLIFTVIFTVFSVAIALFYYFVVMRRKNKLFAR